MAAEAEARKAEAVAIRQESPQFNVAGAIAQARSRVILRPHRWANAIAAWSGSLMLAGFGAILVPVLRVVLEPAFVVLVVASPVLWVPALAVLAAPLIRQFGAWLERNSVYPETEYSLATLKSEAPAAGPIARVAS